MEDNHIEDPRTRTFVAALRARIGMTCDAQVFPGRRPGKPSDMLRRLPGAPAPRPAALPVHFGLADPAGLGPAGARLLRLFGVTATNTGVRVDDETLLARFGPWSVRTPVRNLAHVEVTGPYAAWKVIGPRLSLADRGLTFGTSTRAGVCIAFHDPVPGLEPTGLLRHPSLTVTVAEPELLVVRLRAAMGVPSA